MRRAARESWRIPVSQKAIELISDVDIWRHWEVERWILHNETPGRFGTYGVERSA